MADATTMDAISMKLYGDEKVRRMLTQAPNAIKDALVHFLYSTKKRYLGNRDKDGVFKKQLKRLRTGTGAPSLFKRESATAWPKNLINAFAGVVSKSGSIGSLQLKMKPFVSDVGILQGLNMMDESYSGSNSVNSSNNMVFPVYNNLKKLGVSLKPMMKKGRNAVLQKVLDDYQTFSVKRGDTTLIFDDTLRYKRGKKSGKMRASALLFVLKKHFTMKKKFNFINQFNTLKPEYISKAITILNRRVRALEKGYTSESTFEGRE